MCSLRGISLQGATYDGAMLVDTALDGPELEAIPPIHIAFVPKEEVSTYSMNGETLKLPVYLSTDRVGLLTQLDTPISGKPSQWILSGTALFLNDEE